MTQERKQYTGIESSPITLTTVRPQRTQVHTGYDTLLEDDTLYPQRPATTTRRYRPVETRDLPQQRAVMRPGQKAVRKQDRYDTVNVFVRRRRTTQTPRPQQASLRPQYQPEPEQNTEQEEQEEQDTEPLGSRSTRRQARRSHWLVYIGCGMLAMLLLWLAAVLALNWWNGYQDDVRYGHPRTYQTNARVGHHDSTTPSHFIALNLHHQVEVIEFPGGDATHVQVYLGPTLTGDTSNSDIVTVSFKDVNGDGKLDMIVSVDNVKYPYLNDNGTFRAPKPNEHISM